MVAKRILIGGASGFAGAHCVRHMLASTAWELVLPVSYDHHGLSSRLVRAVEGFPASRYTIVSADLSQPLSSAAREMVGDVDYLVNYASSSHVDRSITDPVPFVMNNVSVMLTLLEYARSLVGLSAFIHVNTDEAFGPSIDRPHTEWDPHIPSNPYAASKSCQAQLGTAWWRTYGVPYIGTHTTNLFGIGQDVEKYTSKIIHKIQNDEVIEVHAQCTGTEWQAGNRIYTPVLNLADAILFLLKRGYVTRYQGKPDSRPDVWNICGERKVANDDWAREIGKLMGKEPKIEYVDVHSARPGHDISYQISDTKIRAAGWRPPMTTAEGLKELIDWENH